MQLVSLGKPQKKKRKPSPTKDLATKRGGGTKGFSGPAIKGGGYFVASLSK